MYISNTHKTHKEKTKKKNNNNRNQSFALFIHSLLSSISQLF